MENEEQPTRSGIPAELSKEERIERHFTTANEHWNEYAFKIYTSVIESRLFDDVEVPLDAFSHSTDLLWKGRNSPLSTIKALMNTFGEQNDPPFTDERKRFLLTHLIRYYWNSRFTGPDGEEYRLDKIESLLQKELDKIPQPNQETRPHFDWQATKEYLVTLPDTTAKIAHLIERKAEYQQTGGLKIGGIPLYDDHCQTEIKKLKDLATLEQQRQAVKSPFKISDKKGSKTDLIRVLNALYELNLIQTENGHLPPKEQFMQQIGGFLGANMDGYARDLEQALNQSPEANAKVFAELQAKATAQVLAKQNSSRK